jgi:hypothetical protein
VIQVLPLSHNVLLVREVTLYTTLIPLDRLGKYFLIHTRSDNNVHSVHTGITHTSLRSTVMVCGESFNSVHRHDADNRLSGPLVIYDPEDPQKSLYDIDDGESIFCTLPLQHRLGLTDE